LACSYFEPCSYSASGQNHETLHRLFFTAALNPSASLAAGAL